MTPEQRDTLGTILRLYEDRLLAHGGSRPEWTALIKGRNALRAALGTCATCAHIDESETHAGYTFCAAPDDLALFPFTHKRMPLDERCKGWTPKDETP